MMKASDYKRGLNGDEPYDNLRDYIESEEGNEKLSELDSHWRQVMELAERYGFMVQAFGGTATLATHAEYMEHLGAEEEAKRLRVCNVEIGDLRR